MRKHLGAFVLGCAVSAFGLGNLEPAVNWTNVASGVWKIEIGAVSNELSYTSLAARPPRITELNQLPPVAYPFVDEPIEFHQSADRIIQVRIPIEADEQLYGFGLQLDGIKQNKKVLTLNVDHWSLGGGRTHAPVPFYISSKGYGVLFNTARFLKVHSAIGNRIDSPNNPVPVDRNPPPEDPAAYPWEAQPDSDAVEAHVTAHGLEVVIFSGENLQDVVSRYNLYCGGGAMPPLWGLGFWHRSGADNTSAEVEAEVADYAAHQIPLDVVGLEPGWMTSSYPSTFEWQPYRFPDPAGFVSNMTARNIKVNLWEHPYVSPEAKLWDPLRPYACSHLVWLGMVPDYTIPEAQDILCAQHQTDHLDIGISGYKIDEVDGYDRWLWPEHAIFPSGTPAESMRQTYGLIMQNMLYKKLFHANNQRTWSLVRSSNAGASGLPFVLYSDSYDHAEYITGISAASLGGILWTPEVREAETAEEWRARIQTVCFSPLAMLNAWYSETTPWDFPTVANDVREAIRLRMRLLPYLYTAFADYNRKGIPPMRAMVLEQENGVSSTELELEDQFMFGPYIMVAPYYQNQTLSRSVKLPKGNWYDFYTGAFIGNDTTITVSTPERIPLFVKEGAVIPMLADHVDNTADAIGMPLEVRHYGDQNGLFELYEDDGNSFDYENGSYSLRTLSFSEGVGSEAITRPGTSLFGAVESWVEMSELPSKVWDGGGAGDSWSTAGNWDPDGVPVSTDNVLVGSGANVTGAQNVFARLTIETNALVTIGVETISGSKVLDVAGTLNRSGVFRFKSMLELSGSLGSGITFLDTDGSTINFYDGASFLNSNIPFEHKGANTFGYTLSETGFSTLDAGQLYSGNGAVWADATYNIDISAYDISNGTQMVLADYAGHSGVFNNTFNPQVNMIAGDSRLGGTLSFNTATSDLVLNLAVIATSKGTPYTWLDGYEITAGSGYEAADLIDSDSDGLLNWEEYRAGTDPTDPGSVLELNGFNATNEQHLISWQAVEGKTYAVSHTTDLADPVWVEQESGIPGVEPECTYTVTVDNVTGFYRIEVE